jgi:hypothetical protein
MHRGLSESWGSGVSSLAEHVCSSCGMQSWMAYRTWRVAIPPVPFGAIKRKKSGSVAERIKNSLVSVFLLSSVVPLLIAPLIGFREDFLTREASGEGVDKVVRSLAWRHGHCVAIVSRCTMNVREKEERERAPLTVAPL